MATQVAYQQRGESLDYVNATEAKILAGTLLPYGSRVAVAGCDIEPGALGSIHVVGVFKDVPKAAEEIKAGTEVYLQEDGSVTATAGDVKAGFAVGDAAADAPTCVVKINA